MTLRSVLTARPVDLPIYRQYVIDHPKHMATALIFFLPWSVTIGFVTVGALACLIFGAAR